MYKKILKKILPITLSFILVFQSIFPAVVYADELLIPDAETVTEETIQEITPEPTTIPEVDPTPTADVTPTPEPTQSIESIPATNSSEVIMEEPSTDLPAEITPTPEPTPEITIASQPETSEIVYGNITINNEYKYKDTKVSINFSRLPHDHGEIRIKEINLSDEQARLSGAVTKTAYEITSNLENGSFEYNLTLPKPDIKTLEVKYSEDGKIFHTSGGVSTTDDKVVITGLNHFTIFVVSGVYIDASPTPVYVPFNSSDSAVIINEFIHHPTSGNEWIELYNKSSNAVNLDGWTLVDSASHQVDLSGTISSHGYHVVEVSSWLNNDTDVIYLKNSQSVDQDIVSYAQGSINDSNLGVYHQGDSLGRVSDGAQDWQIFDIHTRNSSNSFVLDETAPVLQQITPVSNPTSDTTPEYVFSSSENGQITYGGSCSSNTTEATSGNNTIIFNELAIGTYSNCIIQVTDEQENQSEALSVSTFSIIEDTDGDGVANESDNCLSITNQSQLDSDNDGIGDSCDNCPQNANADQADSDGDGRGDICEDTTPPTVVFTENNPQNNLLTASQSHTFSASFNEDVSSCSLSFGLRNGDFELGDLSGWSLSGNSNWYTSNDAHTGLFSGRSGNMYGWNSVSSSIERNVEIVTPSTLSFWWKVSSEGGWDYLRFYLDGIHQNAISGWSNWNLQQYDLTAGTHNLKWSYTKDFSVTYGSDAGWLDDVQIVGASEGGYQMTVDNSTHKASLELSEMNEGSYNYTISCTDNDNNRGTSETRRLEIDTTPPTASISYSTTSITTDPVTATLVPDEEVVITNNEGNSEYIFTSNGLFTFIFTDAAGNTSEVTAEVNNIDTPPAITITGSSPVDIYQNDIYTDLGATAVDEADGDLTESIETINEVNTAVVGNYYVTYTVSDSVGNTTQVSRLVRVLSRESGDNGSSSSPSSSGTSIPSAPVCTDTKPSSAPILLSAVSLFPNEVTLSWLKASDPVSYYLLTFGENSGEQKYGNPNIGDQNTTSYTVKGLSGGQRYYFRVRAGNHCMPGDFSNELSVYVGGQSTTDSAEGFSEGVLGSSSDSEDQSSSEETSMVSDDKNQQTAGLQFQTSDKKENYWYWLVAILPILVFFYLRKKK